MTALAFLTVDEFATRTLLPSNVLSAIESTSPGWLAAQIVGVSSRIQSRLSKRYPDAWEPPYNETLKQWVVDIVSFNAWLKRGVSQTDEAVQAFKDKYATAYNEITEAANGETGLFDLSKTTPDGKTQSAIALGGTRVYSESSPYVWTDVQSRRGRFEDRGGNGGTSS